jgi:ABC-type polysaccharide/polyol phosphate transport system ATPase subunit
MMKEEMEYKFEEIFEFAELSRFRNMKLKNFSLRSLYLYRNPN